MEYSQELRIKTICSTLTKYKKHYAIMKQTFTEGGYQENILKAIDNTDRKDLFRKKEKSNRTTNRVLFPLQIKTA